MTQAEETLAAAAPAALAGQRAELAQFVLLGAIWGSSFLFMRIATVEFGVLPMAAVRVFIAAACLLPMLAWRRLGVPFRRHWKVACVLGVLNPAIPFACFAYALLSITTGLSAILNATVPLFGALVAWAWLGDRPTGSRLLGLAIGFGGVAVLAWDDIGGVGAAAGTTGAVLACLLATLCYALSATATKRYLDGVPPLVTAAAGQLGGAVGLLVPAVWLWPAHPPGAGAWGAVIALGVACTGFAYVLYFQLIDQAGPARAVVVTFLVPVFALVYGALFLGEPVTLKMLVCGAIVLCGTALSTGWLRLRRR